MSAPAFDLSQGLVSLAAELIDIPSESGDEKMLADRVEATLRVAPHLEVIRHGNTVAARTHGGKDTRVIVAGHLDTVPQGPLGPARVENGVLHGRGSVDMKSAIASHLVAALECDQPSVDVTWMFYDQEEVEASRNGLGHFHTAHPDWFVGDVALLGEPSQGGVEGGCNGTMRVELRTTGLAAHSARPWRGKNALHALAEPLAILAGFQPETRAVEGLEYRESLQAVGVRGGIAGNIVPDEAVLTINFRFAPDRSADDALRYLSEVFPGADLTVVDSAEGARPGLTHDVLRDLVSRSGREPGPKYGWTDVARFSALGIPAVNFGPGDGARAHADDEQVPVSEIEHCHTVLREWLS